MPSKKKPAWLEWIVITLVRVLLKFCSALPLAYARVFGALCGGWLYRFNKRIRQVTIRNLELAYPDWPDEVRHRIARQSLQSTGELVTEMGHVWKKPWSYIEGLLDVDGLDSVLSPLEADRGVIVLIPHLGNWEVVGLHLAKLGDLVALYKPLRFKKLDHFVHLRRQKTGGKLVPISRRGIAELLRSVRSGGITAILPDQVPDNLTAGQNSPFFGVDCFTPTLSHNLIGRSGGAVVMGTALRTPSGFQVLYRPADKAVYAQCPDQALAAINREVEYLIEGAEIQYQWQYKRFRCRPAGEVDHYDFSTEVRRHTEHNR